MNYVVNKFLQLFSTCRAYEFFEVLKEKEETARISRSLKSWFKEKLDEYLCDHKQSYRYFIKSILMNKCEFLASNCTLLSRNNDQCSLNVMGFKSKMENGTNVYTLNTNNLEPSFCSYSNYNNNR